MTVRALEATQEAQPTQVVEIVRKKFSVAEFHTMLHAGIFNEDDRIELIDGEIRHMSAVDAVHAANVKRLNQLLMHRLTNRFIIGVQDPIRLNEFSEPEPDLAVLHWHDDFYEQQHPTPADALIIIEVANTSLVYDRQEKLPRYATAGIPEVWLLHVAHRAVEQYTNPENGRYQASKIFTRGMTLQSTTIPDLTLTIEQIFGL